MEQTNVIARLAQFFPGATPVRLPVRVSDVNGASEPTWIEFGTSREVLFRSGLGLEFGQCVHVSSADQAMSADACVVAMQFEHGETAVAARFVHEVANWLVKA